MHGTAMPFFGIAPHHLVKQRDQNAAAGRANRVTNGDRATIDILLAGVQPHFWFRSTSLGGKPR
jgi:hypothetical protein